MCGESAKIIVATVPGPVSHSCIVLWVMWSEVSFSLRIYACVCVCGRGGGGGGGAESD